MTLQETLWYRSGASFQIVRRALEGSIRYAVSVALALEYEAVLHRAALREASWASHEQLDVLLDAFIGGARLITPIRTKLRPTLRDASDDMVLECAVQSGADAIVTVNIRDFTEARSLYRIDVIRPGDFLARLASGGRA